MAEPKCQANWNKEHTTVFSIRLNNRTDSDILEALEGKQRQTEIKRLIRLALETGK